MDDTVPLSRKARPTEAPRPEVARPRAWPDSTANRPPTTAPPPAPAPEPGEELTAKPAIDRNARVAREPPPQLKELWAFFRARSQGPAARAAIHRALARQRLLEAEAEARERREATGPQAERQADGEPAARPWPESTESRPLSELAAARQAPGPTVPSRSTEPPALEELWSLFREAAPRSVRSQGEPREPGDKQSPPVTERRPRDKKPR